MLDVGFNFLSVLSNFVYHFTCFGLIEFTLWMTANILTLLTEMNYIFLIWNPLYLCVFIWINALYERNKRPHQFLRRPGRTKLKLKLGTLKLFFSPLLRVCSKLLSSITFTILSPSFFRFLPPTLIFVEAFESAACALAVRATSAGLSIPGSKLLLLCCLLESSNALSTEDVWHHNYYNIRVRTSEWFVNLY